MATLTESQILQIKPREVTKTNKQTNNNNDKRQPLGENLELIIATIHYLKCLVFKEI